MPDFFDDLDLHCFTCLRILKGLLDLHLLLLLALGHCLRSLFLKISLSDLLNFSFLLCLERTFLEGIDHRTIPNDFVNPVLGSLLGAFQALLDLRLTRELLLVRVR